MSDEDYDHLDHLEIVDQEPVTEREVRSEERERVRFLAEDRLAPDERRDLEARALEGAEEAEIYEASWTPSHDADLDEIHHSIDHEIGEDGQRRSTGRRTVDPSGGGALPSEDRDRLARATPGDLIDHNVEYRTDNGAVVSLRYRGKDGREATTLANVGPDSVRFLDDIRSELDEQRIDLEALDVEAPEPPGDQPSPAPEPSRPEPEPDEPEVEEPADEDEAADEDDETDALVEELTGESGTGETEETGEDWSQEDQELAEELGLSPEELSELTEEEEEDSGGLGGLGLGGSDEDEADDGSSGGGIGGKLGLGKKTEADADADTEEGSGGGIGGKLGFGKKAKADADEDADEGAGGGIGDKLPFGKKQEEDAEDAEESEEDEDDDEGGGIGDKLPFG